MVTFHPLNRVPCAVRTNSAENRYRIIKQQLKVCQEHEMCQGQETARGTVRRPGPVRRGCSGSAVSLRWSVTRTPSRGGWGIVKNSLLSKSWLRDRELGYRYMRFGFFSIV